MVSICKADKHFAASETLIPRMKWNYRTLFKVRGLALLPPGLYLYYILQACQGRNKCNVTVSNAVFVDDPCRGIVKTLAVEARCASSMNISEY